MNKRRKVTVIVVLVMLCLATAAWLLLFDRQFRELNPNGKNAQETITEIIEIIKGPESEITGSAAEILSEWQIADRVYSHRGSAGTDEHSFEAYDAAIEAGSHNIEQDIVISSEGTLYVSHDLSAYAMTGVDRQFSDMTDAEIDGLTRYSGGKVLRLSEVFERYGSKVHYIIELKSSDDATIEAFKNEVDEHDVESLVIVQALENEVLCSLDSIYPDMPKLQVVKTESALWQAMESDVVDIVGARVQFVNEANCNAAHERDKKFAGWTLDSESEIRNAIEVGADAYFTNDTALALELEREYRKKPEKQADSRKSGSDQSTLLFASDYQTADGFDEPSETVRKVVKSAAADGKKIDMAIICGDYTNDAVFHDYQLSGEDSIEEIRSVLDEEASLAENESMLFVQGNHDAMTDSIASSGLHEYDNYLVYVLNTENDFPWKQGKTSGCYEKVKNAASEMKDCFDKLIAEGETRPLFIAGHVPLHFTARTSSRHTTGDNLYSSLVFNAVNEAAMSLDIVYLYGHNHSKGWDCYMGGACVYKEEGDEILLPVFHDGDVSSDQFEAKRLNFTYMNAGYVGYFMNCGPGEDKEAHRAADETLTCSVCEIYPDRIEIMRYDSEGQHVLGADGEANPYKGGIDEGLIDSKYFSREKTSPATITRKAVNAEDAQDVQDAQDEAA